MNKPLNIILICFLIMSCNHGNDNDNKLKDKIAKLEKLNSKLRDSIITINYKKISNSITFGISKDSILKVGKMEKVKFIFHYPEKMIHYDVYTADSTGSPDKLIMENLTDNEFEYEFTPTKSGQELVELIAVFNIKNEFDDEVIEVPIIAGFATNE